MKREIVILCAVLLYTETSLPLPTGNGTLENGTLGNGNGTLGSGNGTLTLTPSTAATLEITPTITNSTYLQSGLSPTVSTETAKIRTTVATPSGLSGDSCEMYKRGLFCDQWLDNRTVFVDSQFPQDRISAFLSSAFRLASDDPCKEFTEATLCRYSYPNCTTTETGIIRRAQLCSHNCQQFEHCREYISNFGLLLATHDSTPLNDFKPSHVDVNDLFQCINPINCPSKPDCQPGPTWPAPDLESEVSCLNDITRGFFAPVSVAPSDSSPDITVTVIASVIVPVAFVGIGTLLFCFWRRRTKKRFPVGVDTLVWDNDVAQAIPETLINEKRLELEEQIGEGNFGIVYRGTLDGDTTVAAKSLKSCSQEKFERRTTNSFIREALRMKKLDHPNVMKLIGICWGKTAASDKSVPVGYGPLIVLPLIVLPYTEMGDLRGYLRSKRRLACGSISSYLNILSDTPEEVPKPKENPVPVDLLLKFGYQIGKGMDYISQQGIVHRDLAARNCMLTWDMKVKVSDFGLARVLEDGKDYYRMGDDCPLPVRWMAIESISDLVFTIESDIWSYGVTLWEIFSLCMMPYAGMSNQEVMSYVQHGSRLEKPDICPDNIYEVMQCCWLVDVTGRPNFSDVVAVIETRLGDGISYVDLQDIEHENKQYVTEQ